MLQTLGFKEYFFLQKEKQHNSWAGLSLYHINKGKKKGKTYLNVPVSRTFRNIKKFTQALQLRDA